jgi:hypothetical protein
MYLEQLHRTSVDVITSGVRTGVVFAALRELEVLALAPWRGSCLLENVHTGGDIPATRHSIPATRNVIPAPANPHPS